MSEIDFNILLNEEYFDSTRCRWARREVEFYINPTVSEMKNKIAYDSRGYITSNGDVYLEGYDEPSVKSMTVHDVIINLLKFHKIIDQNIANRWTCPINVLKCGIAVQRCYDTNYFKLSESVYRTSIDDANMDIQELFSKAQIKNPNFEFLLE